MNHITKAVIDIFQKGSEMLAGTIESGEVHIFTN